jgi:hypothetical protein
MRRVVLAAFYAINDGPKLRDITEPLPNPPPEYRGRGEEEVPKRGEKEI